MAGKERRIQGEAAIRAASPEDAEALLAVYAPYVRKTAITFEYEVPSVTEFRSRVERTLRKYPYLILERDAKILGYAYTGAFVGRAAYDWSAETSIYLEESARGCGLGGRLYGALEAVSAAQHIYSLYACIGYPETADEYLTGNSVEFHRHLGYEPVGNFPNCGYKFGRWYHMMWMEKKLSKRPEHPEPVIPFGELDPAIWENL